MRCWGFGANGRLDLGNTDTVGAVDTPADVPPVNLGPGRTATAISAGGSHTCAILDTGQVRCWGAAGFGNLGLGNPDSVGATNDPADVPPVNLGAGRTATAITAGADHTCAILDTGQVRCWGRGLDGRLGLGNTASVGAADTPADVAPVNLGPGRTALAISADLAHTCAILDTGQVRCWGLGSDGRLGYGSTASVGDDETPGAVLLPSLGPGRTALAVGAGGSHTCATLDTGQVRCWGLGANGRLGYGDTMTRGDVPATIPGLIGGIDLAGALAARVADLSLSSGLSAPSAQVGETLTLTHTITNAGPDTVRAAVAAAPAGGLVAQPATPSSGTFAPAGGVWDVGPLGPGQSATLVVPARVVAPGVLESVSEIASADAPDPDSTPANSAPAEDDRTALTLSVPDPGPQVVQVPGPTVQVPGPTVTVPAEVIAPAPPARVRIDRMTLALTPARSLRGPVRVRATARLLITRAALRPACRGRVVLAARAGARTVLTRRVPLRLVAGVCRAVTTLVVPRVRVAAAPALRVSARFAGNALLIARGAPARSVRLR